MSGYGQGSTRAGRRARAIVLDRSGGMCEIGFDGCTGVATIADHIDNIAAAGILRRDATDPETMQAACAVCHAVKTERERRAGIAQRNARRRKHRRRASEHPGD